MTANDILTNLASMDIGGMARTDRLILADALSEAGREEEAALCRGDAPVIVVDGEVELVELVPTTEWVLQMRDGVSSETEVFDHEPSRSEIEDTIEAWVEGGDWGEEGASIEVGYTVYADEVDGEEVDRGYHTVEIEPDHASLIRQATGGDGCGDDPDDHDWTSEGEGGCDSNPGVWSTGGTGMSFASHCRACGLRRHEHHTGSQRNPGEHDTVQYSMPSAWCSECQREECECEDSGDE